MEQGNLFVQTREMWISELKTKILKSLKDSEDFLGEVRRRIAYYNADMCILEIDSEDLTDLYLGEGYRVPDTLDGCLSEIANMYWLGDAPKDNEPTDRVMKWYKFTER